MLSLEASLSHSDEVQLAYVIILGKGPPLHPSHFSPKRWVLPCLLAVLRVPPLPRERHLGQVGAQLLHLHIGWLAMHTEGLAPPEPSGCVTHSPACVTHSPELRGCRPLLSHLPPHWCPHGRCGPRGQGLSRQAHAMMGLDTSRRATWRDGTARGHSGVSPCGLLGERSSSRNHGFLLVPNTLAK